MNKLCFDPSNSFLGCTLSPDPELSAQGWELRFVGDARMTRDAKDTYIDLGYEGFLAFACRYVTGAQAWTTSPTVLFLRDWNMATLRSVRRLPCIWGYMLCRFSSWVLMPAYDPDDWQAERSK